MFHINKLTASQDRGKWMTTLQFVVSSWTVTRGNQDTGITVSSLLLLVKVLSSTQLDHNHYPTFCYFFSLLIPEPVNLPAQKDHFWSHHSHKPNFHLTFSSGSHWELLSSLSVSILDLWANIFLLSDFLSLKSDQEKLYGLSPNIGISTST